MSREKRVLVTGAGGFIGRWSVPALRSLGYEVHAVLSGGARAALPEQLGAAAVHVADLLNTTAIDALMSRVRPTHLLHFAWIAAPGVYWTSPENFRWVAASEYLLSAFRVHGGARVVMAGSCAEYDWSRVGLCHERSSPLADSGGGTLTPYAQCKLAMQRALADFGRREQVSTAWGRIFFQFGPDEHPARLVPTVIRNLLCNREALVSHGRQIRSFLHVADVGAAFAAMLDSEVEGPVNVGSGERISLADLMDLIGRQIGRSDLVRLGARPAPPQEPALLVPDIHRLREEVRWQPRFALNEALNDTIAWWRRRLPEAAGVRP